jgi:hypothetical protein
MFDPRGEVTGKATKSPKWSGAVSASTGRRLLADKSVKGNGTRTTSPNLEPIVFGIVRIVPDLAERVF